MYRYTPFTFTSIICVQLRSLCILEYYTRTGIRELFNVAFLYELQGALDLICQGQPKTPTSSPDPFATLRAYMRPIEAIGDSRFFKAASLNGACPYSFCTRRTLLPFSDGQGGALHHHVSNTVNNKEDGREVQQEQQNTNSFSLQMVPELPPPYGAAAIGELEVSIYGFARAALTSKCCIFTLFCSLY